MASSRFLDLEDMGLRPQFTKLELRILILLASVEFTHIVEYMILMPLGPQLMQNLHINPNEFALLVSSYDFCAGISGLIGMYFLDRFDRKQSLIYCFLGFGLGTFACALADSFSSLLLARILSGGFGGILGAQAFAIAGDAVAIERRGASTGILMVGLALAMILGIPFSLYLAEVGSWRLPFFSLGYFTLFLNLLLFTILPRQVTHLREKTTSPLILLRIISKQSQTRLALFLQFWMVLGQFTVIPFLASYLVMNVGIPQKQLPFIYLLGGIVSLIAAPLFGNYIDRRGSKKVLMWTVGFSIIPLLGATHLPALSFPVCLSLSVLFFASMTGRLVLMNTVASHAVSSEYRGAFMSLVTSIQQFSGAFSVWVSGHIIGFGKSGSLENFQYVGYLASFASLVVLGLGVLIHKDQSKNQTALTKLE